MRAWQPKCRRLAGGAACAVGTPLRAGDIVMTGALGPMCAIRPGDRVMRRVDSRVGEAGPEMDLRRLQAFVAIAELKNFTKAAELLHIAQPALGLKILQAGRGS